MCLYQYSLRTHHFLIAYDKIKPSKMIVYQITWQRTASYLYVTPLWWTLTPVFFIRPLKFSLTTRRLLYPLHPTCASHTCFRVPSWSIVSPLPVPGQLSHDWLAFLYENAWVSAGSSLCITLAEPSVVSTQKLFSSTSTNTSLLT